MRLPGRIGPVIFGPINPSESNGESVPETGLVTVAESVETIVVEVVELTALAVESADVVSVCDGFGWQFRSNNAVAAASTDIVLWSIMPEKYELKINHAQSLPNDLQFIVHRPDYR